MTTPTPRPGNFPYTPLTAQQMRTERMARNLTQAEVADAIPCSLRHLKRLEHGNHRLTADVKKRFWDYMGYVDAANATRASLAA